jgi:hypothetical protein
MVHYLLDKIHEQGLEQDPEDYDLAEVQHISVLRQSIRRVRREITGQLLDLDECDLKLDHLLDANIARRLANEVESKP